MAKNERPSKLLQVLLDPRTPVAMQLQILRQVALDDGDAERALLAELLAAARAGKAEDLYTLRARELALLLEQMLEGPLRQATFVRLVRSPGFGVRAEVLLQDGVSAFTSVPDAALADELRCGDTVWLEAQAKALLYRQTGAAELGDEAQLERVLADGTVEVQVGELGRFVFRAGAELAGQLERGDAGPGSVLVVCPRRRFAFRALPPEEGLSHYRYLCKDPVPDVVVERDLGAPPRFIGELTRHLRRELADPSAGAGYGLRRSQLRLLTGVPGSGKTFGIHAFWNRMYSVLSETSGVPVAELPPRVMHLEVAKILSKWVGSSDRNIARFFDEAEELAGERLVRGDGTELELPLLLVIEECDAWSRERGEDPIHDRIQTTLLQRLDPSRRLFREHVVFVLCTTNTPELVDPAFVRRAGGKIEAFGRLGRAAFRAVLAKQIARRPFRRAGAASADEARARCTDELVAWLFTKGASDEAQVELSYVGQTTAVTKHRRDFLTAALVDRAVQEACAEACDAEWLGDEDPGLCTASLARALDAQVRHVVEHLTAPTCGRYLTLPDGARVASVRRLPQPAALSFDLERAS